MKTWCFYHRPDFDGECSGAIVKKYCDEQGINVEIRDINYGDEFPFDEIESNDTVYMVDFGLQPFSKMELLHDVSNLIWVDHHATAIDDMSESDINFKGVQEVGIGACRLVWDYLFPDKPVPYAVRLLSEYDVWIHINPDTLPFQYGLRTVVDTKPDSSVWPVLLSSDDGMSNMWIDDYCETGQVIMDYEDQQNEAYCKSFAFPIEFEGLKFIAINRGACSSRVFESIWNTNDYDAMMTFCRHKTKGWTIGMYTDKMGINVGDVAKKYGGGGHIGASGFACEELPFNV